MTTTEARGVVRVYWRPGCPYCAMLRLGLRSARGPAEWVNIWDDEGAAARVRAITGGDETVPTVVVGARAMVNPSVRQVVAALRAGQPGRLPGPGARPGSWLTRAAGFLTRRRPRQDHAANGPDEPPHPDGEAPPDPRSAGAMPRR